MRGDNETGNAVAVDKDTPQALQAALADLSDVALPGFTKGANLTLLAEAIFEEQGTSPPKECVTNKGGRRSSPCFGFHVGVTLPTVVQFIDITTCDLRPAVATGTQSHGTGRTQIARLVIVSTSCSSRQRLSLHSRIPTSQQPETGNESYYNDLQGLPLLGNAWRVAYRCCAKH
jgi:hypothetical protein